MKLIFLGTSAAQPTPDRGLTCICLERDGEIIMFDAGEGSQIAFMKSGLGWNKKMKIFVTHMHGDHCVGILGLIQTMSMQNRTEKLEIFGPKGIDEFVYANIKILNFGLSFPIMISMVEEGKIVDEKEYSIYACKADHSITAYSYRFDEKDKPGRFNRENALSLGIPEGELWKKLQNGENIVVNEKTILPSQVLGEKRPGYKIGISGDTRPNERLREFFDGCHYLTFDTTFLEELRDKALETRHSTAAEAGKFARDANIRNLIMTHFSARYTNTDPLVREGQKFHRSIIAARDLLEVEIK